MAIQERLNMFSVYLSQLDLTESTKRVYLGVAERIQDDPNFHNSMTGTVNNHLNQMYSDVRKEKRSREWSYDLTPEQRIRHLALAELEKRLPELDLYDLKELAGLEE